jgi:hypothetical protein
MRVRYMFSEKSAPGQSGRVDYQDITSISEVKSTVEHNLSID